MDREVESLNTGRGRVALVSEVLDRLLEEVGHEARPRSVLFQAALHACAEESRRVKQGHDPVPLAAIVERARAILESAPGRRVPAAPPVPPSPLPEPPPPFAEPAPEEPSAASDTEEPPTPVSDLVRDPARRPVAAPRARRRSSRALRLAALGPVIFGAIVLYLYLRSRVGTFEGASPRVSATGSAPRPAEFGGVTTGGPTGAGVATPSPLPVPSEAATTSAPAPQAAQPEPGGDGEAAPEVQTMVSPDWAGRAPTFVIHFSSYRERDNAQGDADALTVRYQRPAYAARVTLPDGVWYRVVLGDFPSAAAARAFHDDLAAKKASDLDGVYLITSP